MRASEVEYEMVQLEVVPNEHPLGEPYIVMVPESGDENGKPLPATRLIRTLTIPVRR